MIHPRVVAGVNHLQSGMPSRTKHTATTVFFVHHAKFQSVNKEISRQGLAPGAKTPGALIEAFQAEDTRT